MGESIKSRFKPSFPKKSPKKSNTARPNEAWIVFGNDDKKFPINYLYTIHIQF